MAEEQQNDPYAAIAKPVQENADPYASLSAEQHVEAPAGNTISPAPKQQGLFSSALDSSGLPALAVLGKGLLIHPKDTVSSIPQSLMQEGKRVKDQLKEAWNTPNDEPAHVIERTLYAVPFIGSSLKKADTQHAEGNDAGAAGTMLGLGASALLPEAGGALLKRVSGPMKEAGAGLINKTAGTLKNDFSHGANPGMGYLEGGGKPALTMGGLARRAGDVTEKAGKNLGEAYDKAGAQGANIPVSKVFNEVTEPVSRLRQLQSGIGGTGVTPSVEAYEDSLIPTLANAQQRGGFTPRELFDEVKRPLSKTTRWNDPTMFDLNKVRQETVGRVGGLLTDAVPETGSLNKIYQGASRLANRAESRAETGTPTLARVAHRTGEGLLGAGVGYATHNPALAAIPLLADTVPVKTAAGYGLFQGGRVAPAAGRFFSRGPGRASLFPIRRNEDESQ